MPGKSEKPMTVMGLTQYLDPEFWPGWTDQERGLLAGPANQVGEWIVRRLEAGGCKVQDAYAIVHDRDEREAWDQLRGQVVRELKPRHVHMVVRFAKDGGKLLAELARLAGVEPQYIERPGRGRWGYDNMLSYLTHIKYADKFQYAPTDVATIRGEDYQAVYGLRREAWEKGRASVRRKAADELFEELWEKAFTGEITREQIDLNDDYRRCYALNRVKIDDALTSYADKRARVAADKLRRGEFSTAIYFVTGHSGSGKTYAAQQLAAGFVAQAGQHGERWGVYDAATNNPLDDWKGEEVVLLNDLRADAMTATEWLLLLDPNTASPAAARYKNKLNVAPRVIIVTAVLHPYDFFARVKNKGGEGEVVDQFIRRLGNIVHVIETDGLLDGRAYVVQQIVKYVRADGVGGFTFYMPNRDGYGVRAMHMSYGPAGSWVMGFQDMRDGLIRQGWSRFHDLPALEGKDWGEHSSLTTVPLRALEARDLSPDTVAPPVLRVPLADEGVRRAVEGAAGVVDAA